MCNFTGNLYSMRMTLFFFFHLSCICSMLKSYLNRLYCRRRCHCQALCKSLPRHKDDISMLVNWSSQAFFPVLSHRAKDNDRQTEI